jgi:hypothetical protein
MAGQLPRTRYNDRGRQLVNSSDASTFFRRYFHVRVAPATIRQWVTRKHIGSYGKGRERYDLREIVEYARRTGIIP